MIHAHHFFDYPDLKGFGGLSHQLSNSLRSKPGIGTLLPLQSGTQFENHMIFVSVFIAAPLVQHIVAAHHSKPYLH